MLPHYVGHIVIYLGQVCGLDLHFRAKPLFEECGIFFAAIPTARPAVTPRSSIVYPHELPEVRCQQHWEKQLLWPRWILASSLH